MTFKEYAMEALEVAKPHLKEILKDEISVILVPKLLDPALDKLKEIIPSKIDDSIIEAFRPQIKDFLLKLAEGL